MERRDLSHKEKLYLREQNVITETQCTLGRNELFSSCVFNCYQHFICLVMVHAVCLFPGLTALRSDEVIDLMIKEYPTKHSEYSVILQERERQRIAKEYSVSNILISTNLIIPFAVFLWHNFHTCIPIYFLKQMQQQNPQKVEASKVPEYIKKAAKKAAEFNSNFNRERMEERRAYFDLQTHVHSWSCVLSLDDVVNCKVYREICCVSDYSGAPGQVQGLGSRIDPDWPLSCGSHTRTVPRILQKVNLKKNILLQSHTSTVA